MTGLESKSVQRTAFSKLRPITVREALQEGAELLSRAGVESARLDAELLLGKAFGRTREEIYLNYETELGREVEELFNALLRRRARREPIAYITGEREFWSLGFLVTPEVLVPRPETELLVEVTLELVKKSEGNHPVKILDLGTGSGIVAVSLAKEIDDVELWATDLSARALKVAQTNAMRHGVEEKIRFLPGDAFEPVRGQTDFFNVIVSNPPYVRRGELGSLPPEIREWEPRLALDGGADGLVFYRRIAEESHFYLAGGGFVAVEIGADMGAEVCRLFAGAGRYSTPSVYQDYARMDRVVVAQRLPFDARKAKSQSGN